MSTIRITINVDNAAFAESGGSEAARILRQLAADYEVDGFYLSDTLRDINGNVVGKAELVEP